MKHDFKVGDRVGLADDTTTPSRYISGVVKAVDHAGPFPVWVEANFEDGHGCHAFCSSELTKIEKRCNLCEWYCPQRGGYCSIRQPFNCIEDCADFQPKEVPVRKSKKEFVLTAEVIRKIAEACPDAGKVLRDKYPEAFEEEWEDVTEKFKLSWHNHGDGFYDIHFRSGEKGGMTPSASSPAWMYEDGSFRIIPSPDKNSFRIEGRR